MKKENREGIYFKECGRLIINWGEALGTMKGA
jgi:hypothetical protein